MVKRIEYKPGEICPFSGQFEIVDPQGKRSGQERTVTRGEPFPPVPKRGQKYILVDPTLHESGKRR